MPSGLGRGREKGLDSGICWVPALIGLRLSPHRLHVDLRAGATERSQSSLCDQIKRRGANRVKSKVGPRRETVGGIPRFPPQRMAGWVGAAEYLASRDFRAVSEGYRTIDVLLVAVIVGFRIGSTAATSAVAILLRFKPTRIWTIGVLGFPLCRSRGGENN